VKCDEEHLERLKEMRGCLEAGPRQMTAKNRARLRQFDDPENVRALYSLPDLLVAEAARAKTPTRSDALVVQTALAISIFLMIPIRIETLINIDFERHLVWTLKKGTVYLSIPEHEVKNRIAIEAALPARCVQILDLYLTKYRPLLLIGPSTSLFPGRTVGPKEQQTMRTQITKTVKSRCGMDVNPHLFRHIAGKVWLDAHPGSFGVVTLLLGHKSVNTTTKFYCGMETAAALRQFDDHVLGLGVGGSNAPNICKRAKA
jgi:integrase